MTLKADWFAYIHKFRAGEASLIFDRFPPGCFRRTLELGAGDGFQSGMIRAHTESLVSTDYRRPPIDDETIEVRELAAEDVAGAFDAGEFDLVYSSNMLEHIPDPQAVLSAVKVVLADDGITIHVMPNQVWKICQLALYVPNLVATAMDDLIRTRRVGAVVERLKKAQGSSGPGHDTTEKNNPTVVRRRRSLIERVLLPTPHGVSATHGEEFKAFSRQRWRTEFERAGFDLVAVLNGPASSGYGFGFDSARTLLEKRGVGSEYVYVAKKAGKAARHAAAFDEVT